MLTQNQGRILLSIAREALTNKKKNRNDEFLKQKRGVFVTITLNSELRGCIGLPYPTKNLSKAVTEAAISAAFKDPRFKPLNENELNKTKLEISVLTKPEKCTLEDIRKGDGIIMENKSRSALFLPQVWEELAEKTLFLEQLSMKAFLPHNAYQTANFQKFSVQIFKE